MCARPRRVPQDLLLSTAARVVTARGADHTRLADVAAASGLAPATLLQRFGSREGLLDAVAATLLADLRAAFQGSSGSPLQDLGAALATVAGAGHLSFHTARPAGAAAWSVELRKQIAFSLISAVEHGELPHCDVAALARRVQLLFDGAALAAQLEASVVDASVVDALLSEAIASV